MATRNYTNLIQTLKSIPRGDSESDNRKGMITALEAVKLSNLPESNKEQLRKTICQSANPSGWYFDSNGTHEAIKALDSIRAHTNDSKDLSPASAILVSRSVRGQTEDNMSTLRMFNRRNLKNLVSDGRIFSVEFIKRSTGELRTMTARIGVKKHLNGGYKSYNPGQHNLLTFFDMDAKGYRSIPVEAIQRLKVGGQTFDFAGV